MHLMDVLSDTFLENLGHPIRHCPEIVKHVVAGYKTAISCRFFFLHLSLNNDKTQQPYFVDKLKK